MNWLQNLIIVVVCYLLARVLIDAGIHRVLVHRLIDRSNSTISSLTTGLLVASYSLSMFFPNIIVLLSLLPVTKYILGNIEGESLRQEISTPLALALIYGANIGGMASLIGSPLNLFYVGYIEIHQIQGHENITFFSWLLLGIPATFILILISRWILKTNEVNRPITFSDYDREEGAGITNKTFRKYLLFFSFNILFIIILTAAQFFFKPGKILYNLNIIDTILLGYLLMILFFSFVFPKKGESGKRSPLKYKKNILFLLLYVLFFPLIYIVETLKELWKRLKLTPAKFILRFDLKIQNTFNRIWNTCFKENFQEYLKSRNNKAFVSIDGLIYDLPFWGLLFMGMVILIVFFVLAFGDNPGTPQWDGYVVKFFEVIANRVIPGDNQSIFFLLGIIVISIFMTEFINNTTVVLIMIPAVFKILSVGDINPLFYLLAISTAASGAFMTPVATPVNAIGYAGIEKVSLKRMVRNGFILNIVSALWLTGFFYILSQLVK